MQSHQRVTELVTFIAGDRPFLGEAVVPVFAVPEAGETGNVLHYSEILVVGFFHQEAVVLDAGFDRGHRVLLAQGVDAEQQNCRQNEEAGMATLANPTP